MIKQIALAALMTLTTGTTMAEPRAPSAADIIAGKDQHYQQEIDRINKQDPEKDAQAVIDLAFPYLMAHYNGRSSRLVVPGLNDKEMQQAQQYCPVLIMRDMGDAIYGATHMEYRKVITNYASEFNKMTYKACMDNIE